MRPKWWMAMLVMLQEAWSSRRDAHLRFMKVQIEMLQSRLPGNRVILSPAERQRLLKMGLEVDHAVEHTLAIVNIKTYRAWLGAAVGGRVRIAWSEGFRARAEDKTNRLIQRSRRRGIARWPKGILLTDNWVDILLDKVERTHGHRIELTPTERRFVLILGLNYFFRLLREGKIK